MSEWISVEAELPKPYTEVLVFPYPTDYAMTAEFYASQDKWYYHEYEHHYGDVVYETKPTHWQLIPEPPKA